MQIFLILFYLSIVVQSQYILGELNQKLSTITKLIYDLDYSGKDKSLMGSENLIIESLRLEIRKENQNQVDIRIVDNDNKMYRIPQDKEPFKSTFNDIEDPIPLNESEYQYNIETQNNPFKLQVKRKVTEEVIFQITDLEFSQFYITYVTEITSKDLFGLGERNQKGFRFTEGKYTLMAREVSELVEDGKSPGKHVYSSQPIYLQREKSGSFHVFFYKTASPIDVHYFNGFMKFITIGGVIHLKLFFGNDKPDNAIIKYHDYLGGWILHPFWSSGFQMSSQSYQTPDQLIEVIQKNHVNKIPLDVVWSVHDYKNQAINEQQFQMIQETLKSHYVQLIDVGVKQQESIALQKGIEMDVFLRSPKNGQRFKGLIRDKHSYFLDFSHPNITQYWTDMLKSLHEKIKFDGLWMSMNEPANFCSGECDWEQEVLERLSAEENYVNQSYIREPIKLPYNPGNVEFQSHTLDPHVVNYEGNQHKDIHNLYGFMETYYTFKTQKELGRVLPFALSQSTFPGSGKYSFHSFGDNAANWDFLYMSIGQVFQFQVFSKIKNIITKIFGIPFSGADICGSMQPTEELLCARWAQLGSIYPFSRNHNNDLTKSQEFYNLGNIVMKSAQKNIQLRYSLLKWYYNLFIRAGFHGSIFKPLFFEYPDDPYTLQDRVLDTQIILGNELMAAPILEQFSFIRSVYFPKGTWYQLVQGLKYTNSDEHPTDHLVYCHHDDYLPLFIRGGSIILQSPIDEIKTTHDLNSSYNIIIALEQNKGGDPIFSASGTFIDLNNFSDENEVKNECIDNSCLLDILFEKEKDNYQLKIINKKTQQPPKNQIIITKISFYGINFNETIIKCNDGNNEEINCQQLEHTYKYNTYISFNQPVMIGGNSKNSEINIQFTKLI